jgi:hypothetical protein
LPVVDAFDARVVGAAVWRAGPDAVRVGEAFDARPSARVAIRRRWRAHTAGAAWRTDRRGPARGPRGGASARAPRRRAARSPVRSRRVRGAGSAAPNGDGKPRCCPKKCFRKFHGRASPEARGFRAASSCLLRFGTVMREEADARPVESWARVAAQGRFWVDVVRAAPV